ncbi:hypothetical protein Pcinc_013164 [Petrolisthes cinctipes]|uniref:Uncharacterized protein n=1 Tax=Petrolisthes cinctipes TaxID=88211 RepID=A0AAE1KSY8_PETCI|nr:hypothetical protein Pcinc_013164 [Petrolisthes cinctipes]
MKKASLPVPPLPTPQLTLAGCTDGSSGDNNKLLIMSPMWQQEYQSLNISGWQQEYQSLNISGGPHLHSPPPPLLTQPSQLVELVMQKKTYLSLQS